MGWCKKLCEILPLIRADDDEAPGGQFAVIGRSQGRRQYLLYLMCIWSGRNQIPWLCRAARKQIVVGRSEEHTSALQSLMRISYAVFCLNKTKSNAHLGIHAHPSRYIM